MQTQSAQVLYGCEVCSDTIEALKVFVIQVSESSFKVLIEGTHISSQKTLSVKHFTNKQVATTYYNHLILSLSTAYMA